MPQATRIECDKVFGFKSERNSEVANKTSAYFEGNLNHLPHLPIFLEGNFPGIGIVN